MDNTAVQDFKTKRKRNHAKPVNQEAVGRLRLHATQVAAGKYPLPELTFRSFADVKSNGRPSLRCRQGSDSSDDSGNNARAADNIETAACQKLCAREVTVLYLGADGIPLFTEKTLVEAQWRGSDFLAMSL